MLHFFDGIRDFSCLRSNLVPDPSIDSIRELDDMFCSCFERISKCMPDEVFSFYTDNHNCILAYAVRDLNLFPVGDGKIKPTVAGEKQPIIAGFI